MKRRFLYAGVVLAVCFLIYSLCWAVGAHYIKSYIQSLNTPEEKIGAHVVLANARVGGFPGVYHVRMRGSVSYGYQRLQMPEIRIRSFFIPGTGVHIELPQGGFIEGAEDEDLWRADYAMLQTHIPLHWPESSSETALRAWKEKVPDITIEALELRKDDLRLQAQGEIGLDDELQPAGRAEVTVRGYYEFLDYLLKKEIINEKDLFLARAALTSLAAPGSQIMDPTAQASLWLKKRKLSLGPLKILKLPRIVWATDNSPALPQ